MSAQRALGIAAAVALLAAAGGGTVALRNAQLEQSAAESQQQAEKARDLAQQALKEHVRRLQMRAESAATLPELRAQIGAVDANTLRDGFSTEPWWLPVRREAPISALAISGEAIDLALGAHEPDVDAAALVRTAREERSTTGFISFRGAPYLAAASVVDKPGRSVAPVLVLARPLDADLLAAVAKKAGAAVLVSDGSRALAASGTKEEKARLQTLVGSEKQPRKAQDRAWTGKAAQLGPSA
jgi:hypothetical protein